MTAASIAFRLHSQHSQQLRFASSWWPFGSDSSSSTNQAEGSSSSDSDLSGEDGSSSAAFASDAVQSSSSSGVGDLVDADMIAEVAALAETDALAAAAEISWYNTAAVEQLLAYAHHSQGLAWWEAIAAVTVVFRILTLPVTVKTMRESAKLAACKPELERLNAEMSDKKMRGTFSAEDHRQRMTDVWKRHDASPARPMLGSLVNAVVFISFYRAITNLAEVKVPSMMAGGTAWFPDLCAADPTYALPVLCGLSLLATAELGAADGMEGMDEATRRRMRLFMRAFAVAIPVFAHSFPTGVFVYWITSNMYSLVQMRVLRIQDVRRILKLPQRGAAAGVGSVSLESVRAAPMEGVVGAGEARDAILGGKPVKTFKRRAKQAKKQ